MDPVVEPVPGSFGRIVGPKDETVVYGRESGPPPYEAGIIPVEFAQNPCPERILRWTTAYLRSTFADMEPVPYPKVPRWIPFQPGCG